MEIDRDTYGVPFEPAERMQQAMLGLFDLLDEAGQAEFPHELVGDLNTVRLRFLDEFERKFPGYGKGRAVWR